MVDARFAGVLMIALIAACSERAEGEPSRAPTGPHRPALASGEAGTGAGPQVDPLYAGGDFELLPPPRAGSWRTRVKEKPQTLREFQGEGRLRPTELRQTLYLQPLGRYPESPILPGDLPSLPLVEDGLVTFVFAPSPEELRDFIAIFYRLPTEVRDEIGPTSLVPAPARVRRHHGQFNAHSMLDALGATLPEDAFSLTALMVRDLYAEEAQEYAFGHAIHEARVAVASFVQLDPQFIGHARRDDFRQRLRERAYKLVAHEIGHTLGMEHCGEFRCLMNGVADVGELDEAPLHLGPQCLEKFLWLVDADPGARYAELSVHYRRHGLERSSEWARLRARRLR